MPDLDIRREIDAIERRDPPSRPDRYRVCEVCGQVYDTQHLGQSFHHQDGPHEPLPPDPG